MVDAKRQIEFRHYQESSAPLDPEDGGGKAGWFISTKAQTNRQREIETDRRTDLPLGIDNRPVILLGASLRSDADSPQYLTNMSFPLSSTSWLLFRVPSCNKKRRRASSVSFRLVRFKSD